MKRPLQTRVVCLGSVCNSFQHVLIRPSLRVHETAREGLNRLVYLGEKLLNCFNLDLTILMARYVTP